MTICDDKNCSCATGQTCAWNDTKGCDCCGQGYTACDYSNNSGYACCPNQGEICCPGIDSNHTSMCCISTDQCGFDSNGNGACGNCRYNLTKEITNCNSGEQCCTYSNGFPGNPSLNPPGCCQSDETCCYTATNGTKANSNCCPSGTKCCNGGGIDPGFWPYTCCDNDQECCQGVNGFICCGGSTNSTCAIDATYKNGVCCEANQFAFCADPEGPCMCCNNGQTVSCDSNNNCTCKSNQ
ncbi:MAG: hypothetical protein FJZ59_07500 [Chlamydiae bacterium]|nr:hypothetical protein [Chlamydiota bacterium]